MVTPFRFPKFQLVFFSISSVWNAFSASEGLHPFGLEAGDMFLPNCDDCSWGPVKLKNPITVFGMPTQVCYVNTNGGISFTKPVHEFSPACSPTDEPENMIAPFWADVDTRFMGNVSFRDVDDASALSAIAADIKEAFPASNIPLLLSALVVTWHSVGAYGLGTTSPANTFQMALATDGYASYAIFNYESVEWTRGTESEVDAWAGLHAADGVPQHVYSLAASCSDLMINMTSRSNFLHPGKFVLQINTPRVLLPGSCSTANPASTATVSPRTVSLRGYELVTMSGPCTNKTNSVACFVKSEGGNVQSGKAAVLNKRTIGCITPPLTTSMTAGTGRIDFILSMTNGQQYNISRELTVMEDTQEKNLHVFSCEKDGDAQLCMLIWDPTKVYENPTTVQIVLHSFNPIGDTVLTAANNSGHFKVRIPEAALETNKPLTIGLIPEKEGISPMLMADAEEFMNKFWTRNSERCEQWYNNAGVPESSTICPPIELLANFDPRFEASVLMRNYYHPDADVCYRSIMSQPLQDCCYKNGFAECGLRTGGNVILNDPSTSYLEYLSNDVVPFYDCCKTDESGSINSSTCAMFYEKRPANCGQGYEPPVVGGGGLGDPHFMTLDGVSYTFNGFGEYQLIRTSDCVVQVRLGTTPMISTATAVKAVAMSCGTQPSVQVEADESGSMQIYSGLGKRLFFSPNQQMIKISDHIQVRKVGPALMLFSPRLSVLLTIKFGILENTLFVAPSEAGNAIAVGLAGKFDGDRRNDLMPRGNVSLRSLDITESSNSSNSTELPHLLNIPEIPILPEVIIESPYITESPISSISPDYARAVFYQFGETWRVSRNESIFFYPAGTSYDTFNKPDFVPVFLLEPKESFPESVRDVCQNVQACYMDYQASHSIQIAMNTLQLIISLLNKRSAMETARTIKVCPTPSNPANGVADYSTLISGSKVTFRCKPGYEETTTGTLECSANGSWLGEPTTCNEITTTTTAVPTTTTETPTTETSTTTTTEAPTTSTRTKPAIIPASPYFSPPSPEGFDKFGYKELDMVLNPCDDCSSDEIKLSFPMKIFNGIRTSCWVNNNGAISLKSPLPQYTPSCLPSQQQYEVLAPYWADVDTRHLGLVLYRQTNNAAVLANARNDISAVFPQMSPPNLIWALVATWYQVGTFGFAEFSTNNTFQAIITSDGYSTFAIFRYGNLTWSRGAESNLDAFAGFNSGRRPTSIPIHSLPHSCSQDVLQLQNLSNTGTPGKFVYQIDGDLIGDPKTCTFPTEEQMSLVTITPRELGLYGNELVTLSGLCLGKVSNVSCAVKDRTLGLVPGKALVLDFRTAGCVTPTFAAAGLAKIQFTISLFNDTFTTERDVVVGRPRRVLGINLTSPGSATITWDRSWFDSLTSVDIKLYTFQNGSSVTLKTVANTGKENVTISPIYFNWSQPTTRTILVEPTVTSGGRGIFADIEEFAQRFWGGGYDFCQNWLRGQTIQPNPSTACPPLMIQARIDPRFIISRRAKRFMHYPAKECYRSIPIKDGDQIQECCYQLTDSLVCAPLMGGIPKTNDPSQNVFKYMDGEMTPFQSCCRSEARSVLKQQTCRMYYEKLGSDCGTKYSTDEVRANAYAHGDPIFTTFDRTHYAFNGFGEYHFIRSPDCNVQVRLRPKQGAGNGTSIQAVAVKCGAGNHLQIQASSFDQMMIYTSNKFYMRIVENDFPTRIGPEMSIVNSFGDFIISTKNLRVVVSYGGLKAMLVQAFVTSTYAGNTNGLAGNLDGDPTNDLSPRNADTPLPSNASLSGIHWAFGESWRVKPEETIFVYLGDDDTRAAHHDLAYIPPLEPALVPSQMESELCGNNVTCLFDLYMSGEINLAEEAMLIEYVMQVSDGEMQRKVERCNAPPKPVNGYAVFNGTAVGSKANFACDPTFKLNSTVPLVCNAGGVWTGAVPKCQKTVVVGGGK